ncbi:integrin beta-PS isoform X2 [Coccinella septempunctata]|uniref:integrin beta-PS isoform X2 n=1 Tax=Coccinella septempunctata TaxID=41139 RepID=UPI001D05C4F5|nr:integrin beta-PS isoform X2 [Coccinella septempunctata]
MEMNNLSLLLISCWIVSCVIAQIPEQLSAQNPCISKPNCHECIQTPSCAWCFDPNRESDRARCFQPAYDINPNQEQCPEEFTFNPNSIMSLVSNMALTKAHGKAAVAGGTMESGYSYSNSSSSSYSSSASAGEESNWSESASNQIVQIAPQRISLKLRARQSYSIYMNYTQAEDYPVDLYYLMDLSKSMADDKEKLSLLGDQLAWTMRNITSKFALGFGSFVDKVRMPYVSTVPENLLHPCPDCAAPYGFRHMMRLSKDTCRFSMMVKQAEVSGNLDAPEGGFDAIMQAIACREQIGWRQKARRLLVVSTDAGFHYAGDGKLGGIVKPNDGKCHLDTRGYYTHSDLQDYPSVSQINAKVKKNAINIIFAVTADKTAVYEQLKSHIEGASAATLSSDSSNIVELIKNQYQQISSSVEMRHNASSALNIKFFTRCLNQDGAMINTNKCGNIRVGDIVNFMIQIEVVKCPKNPKDWKETIEFYPVGINETLVVDLEMLCSCPCEQPDSPNYQVNSPQCHNHGTYQCGICDCNFGSFGRFCECTTEKISQNTTRGCIQPGSPSGLECSGRGSCICGRCECEARGYNERIYGPYCECDDFSCERHNGQLCSGHGVCDCGHCICTNGWSGNNCACSEAKEECVNPENNEVCSGHGVCECGMCKCQVTTEGRYSGRYCEKCPTCSDRCEEFKDCVQCQMYETGSYSKEECLEKCKLFTPIPVDKVVVDEKKNEISCAFYDEDNCRYAFVYYFEAGHFVVRAQEHRDCPPKVFLLGIILGVVAAVVLMGLAIVLLWKLYTTLHDRREFAKFEKERMMAKWDTGENPIYKQATSTFKNPTYAGKS